ncbi:MAG: YjbF family lipoprotein [Pseudomonadota bacterium]
MRLAALGLGLLLAACGTGAPQDMAGIGLDLVRNQGPSSAVPEAKPTPEASGSAVLELQSANTGRAYLTEVTQNAEYVTYQDAAGRTVVLHGGLVTRTQGYPRNLVGVRFGREDPIARARPLDAWPGQVDRAYQFRTRHGPTRSIVLHCVMARGDRQFIDILGDRHEVVEVEEACANTRLAVSNRHWVEPDTGVIWQSTQWIGGVASALTMTVIRRPIPDERW